MRRSFLEDFRRFFMRGLAALMPAAITIALLAWLFDWVNDRIATPITNSVIAFLPDPDDVPRVFQILKIAPETDSLTYGHRIDEFDNQGRQLTVEYILITHPAMKSPDPVIAQAAQHRRAQATWQITFTKWYLNVFGFAVAVMIVYIIGYLLTGFLGRTLWKIVESFLNRIPVIKSIYPSVKQVTDFFLGGKEFKFTSIVAVQWPRKGVWALGMMTGPALKEVQDHNREEEMVGVFVPNTPTPVTGFAVMVPRREIIDLHMTLDEAFKFVISGGLLKPPESASAAGSSDLNQLPNKQLESNRSD